MRSRPRPKAQPTWCGTSELTRSSCLIIPQPRISSQSPCQKTSSSQDGLVNGKKASTQRTFSGSGGWSLPLAALLASVKILMTINSRERLRCADRASTSSAEWCCDWSGLRCGWVVGLGSSTMTSCAGSALTSFSIVAVVSLECFNGSLSGRFHNLAPSI